MLSLPHAVPSIATAVGADHPAPASETDVVLLLAIPMLWLAGVVLLIVHKFRAREAMLETLPAIVAITLIDLPMSGGNALLLGMGGRGPPRPPPPKASGVGAGAAPA